MVPKGDGAPGGENKGGIGEVGGLGSCSLESWPEGGRGGGGERISTTSKVQRRGGGL